MRIKWKFSLITTLFVVLALLPQTILAQSQMQVYVGGKKINLPKDQQPYLNKGGYTMMSIRGLSDGLGYSVKWNSQKKQVELTHNGTKVILPVNRKVVTVNGKRVTIDTATEMKNGRVYVPLRFVSQTFGAKVTYNSKTKVVSITEKVVKPPASKPTSNPNATPKPTPTPTPTPNPSPSNIPTLSSYTVQSGDTLFKIATRYKVSVATIKALNGLKNDTIKVGQTLKLTANKQYIVVRGDTLYKVAKAHGVTIDAIKEASNLTTNSLKVAQILWIPSPTNEKEEEKPKTPTQPKEQVATVKVNGGLNVRAGGSTAHKIVGYLSNGTVVTVQNTSNGWAKITYGTLNGWVNESYIVYGVKEEKPVVSNGVLKGKIVILDPGHGGSDVGAIAIGGKVYEKTLNLSYSEAIKAELEKLGATVYMTRNSDTRCGGVWNAGSTEDLQCRVDFAKAKKGHIFISVHFNSAYGATGTETFYNKTMLNGHTNPYPKESEQLAKLVHQYYRPAVNLPDRGVKPANYYVNNRASMPSILLEFGFISNQRDLERVQLDTVKKNVSIAVAKGVQEYFTK